MKLQPRWMILTLALGLMLAIYVSTQANYALLASPTAEAIADVQKTYRDLDETAKIEADTKSRQEQIQVEQQRRRQELQQLQLDLELLPAGSEDFMQTQDEMLQKAFELDSWLKFEIQKLQRGVQSERERISKKMLDAIGRVAEKNGYDIVLTPMDPVQVQVPTANPNQPQFRTLPTRNVLWHNKKHDITDQIIQLMNNEFRSLRPTQ